MSWPIRPRKRSRRLDSIGSRNRGHRTRDLLPALERMEDRIVLATVSGSGSILTIALGTGDSLTVSGSTSSYTFQLNNSGGTFTEGSPGPGGTFSGFGTSSLSLSTSGDPYSTIAINDSGGTGTNVDVYGTYATSLDISLTNSPVAGAVGLYGTHFTGSAGVTVDTTGDVGTYDSTIELEDGSISLTGGDPAHGGPVAGVTIGVINNQEIDVTGSGSVTLVGTGGTTSGDENTGVRFFNSGSVVATTGSVTVQGTAGVGGGADAGVAMYVGSGDQGVYSSVTTTTGNITVTGTAPAGSTAPGFLLYGSKPMSTGSGTIAITGVASANDGVQVQSNCPITSGSGNIAITGSTTSSSGHDGINLEGSGASVDSSSGVITISGTTESTIGGLEHGVYLTGGASIGSSSDDGSITIFGSDPSGPGVALFANSFTPGGATIETGGSGSISIVGESTSSDAFFLQGYSGSTVAIEATGTGGVNLADFEPTGPGNGDIHLDDATIQAGGAVGISTDNAAVAGGTGSNDVNFFDTTEVQSTGSTATISSGNNVSLNGASTIAGSGGITIAGQVGGSSSTAGANITLLGTLTTSAGDVSVQGGAAASTITVAPALANKTIAVTTTAGPAALTIDGSASGGDVVTVGPTSTTLNTADGLGHEVTYTSSATSIAVDETAGTNTFDVTPSQTAAIAIQGNPNSSPAADTLSLTTPAGVTATQTKTSSTSGIYSFNGGSPSYKGVTYSSIASENTTSTAGTLVSDGGTGTLTIDLQPNVGLSVQTSGPVYTFTLSGSGATFDNAGVSNAAMFSGFGTSTLTLQAAAGYATIDIEDGGTAGGTGDQVIFASSGSNAYSTSFDVALNSSPMLPAVEIGQSTFAGSAGLTVVAAGQVYLRGATLTTDNGPISLTGNAGSAGVGVSITAGGQIISTGTGSITVDGSATGYNAVDIHGGGALLSSVDGNISIGGTGGGAGTTAGVAIYGGPEITSTGTATISITGTNTGGGDGVDIYNNTGDSAHFVSIGATAAGSIDISGNSSGSSGTYLAGPDIWLTASSGNVSLTGTSTASSGGSYGVLFYGGDTIGATAGGSVAISGTNTGGGGGVYMANNSGTSDHDIAITAAGAGSVSLSGTAVSNNGVYLQGAGVSLGTTSGSVSISGTSSADDGIQLLSVDVSTVSGPINIQGSVSGTTSGGSGVLIDGGLISSTGTGTVGQLTIGGKTKGTGIATEIEGTSTVPDGVSSVDADIAIDGNGAGGVYIDQGAVVSATGAGGVTVGGKAVTSAAVASTLDGLDLGGGGTEISAGSGGVEIDGQSDTSTGAEIAGGAAIETTGGGAVTIDPAVGSVSVDTGGLVSASGPLTISTAYFAGGTADVDILTGGSVASTGAAATIQAGGSVDVDAASKLSAQGPLAIQDDVIGSSGLMSTSITLLGTLSGAPTTVTAGEFNQSIDFGPTASGPALIQGAGSDAITVAPGGVTGVVNVYSSAAGGSSLTIDGTSGNDNFAVGGAQTTLGAATVAYAGFTAVTVDGLGGTNDYSVSPSKTVTLNINGDPSSPLVDLLTVLAPAGQTSTVNNGTTAGSGDVTTTGGYLPVNFTNIAAFPGPTKVADNNTTTLTITLGGDTTLDVQANKSSYTFTLSTGVFSNAGVAAGVSGLFSGFGTSTLTLQSYNGGSPTYATIAVVDAGANDAVDFQNSGTNSYDSSFSVTLTDSPQAAAVAINQSTFASTTGLTVSTTGGVAVLGPVSTFAGVVSLSGNSGGTATGDLIGVVVASSITTTTGNIHLAGTGGTGTDAGANEGILVANGGKLVSSYGTVTLAGGVSAGDDDTAVEFSATPGTIAFGSNRVTTGLPLPTGITSANGNVQVTGTGSGGDGVELTSGAAITSTGAATIAITGTTTGTADGVLLQGTGTLVTSTYGAITIAGSAGGTAPGDGLRVQDGAAITSKGTGTAAATVTLAGTGGQTGNGIIVDEASVGAVDGPVTLSGTARSGDAVQIAGISGSESSLNATGLAGIHVTATGGPLIVDDSMVTTASGAVSLAATSTQDVEILDGSYIGATANNITIQAGDFAEVDYQSVVSAAGTGFTFTIIGGADNAGGKVQVDGYLEGGATGQIDGGGGSDTISVDPIASPALAINGGAGLDSIQVFPAAVSGPIAVNEASGAGPDILTIFGSAQGGDVFSAGGLATLVDGHAVTYSPYISTINLQSTGGTDTFLVSPSTTAAINVLGPNPNDDGTLIYEGPSSATHSGNSTTGSFTASGYGAVGYNYLSGAGFSSTGTGLYVKDVIFSYGSSGKTYEVSGALPRDLPWAINSVAFVFSENAYATLSSLSLSGIDVPAIKSFSGNGTTTLTWTFSSPVEETAVIASLASSGTNAVTDGSGNGLIGNTAPSGANPFDIVIEDLYGDVDGSGTVDSQDAILVLEASEGKTVSIPSIFLDVNGDGSVNSTDETIVRSRMGTSI